MRLLLLTLLVFSGPVWSETPEPVVTPDVTASPPPVAKNPQDDPLYPKAQQFDEFLSDRMEPKAKRELVEACEQKPGDNLFCYAITHREELETKAKLKFTKTPSGKSGPVVVKFKKGKVHNWDILRSQSIGALVRSVQSVSKEDFPILKARALKENRCPNNASIAVAAALEDQLPENAKPEDIAFLYFRGGDCLVESPADRENLLTRAGLFYYMKKDFKMAAVLLAKSSGLKGTFVTRALYWLYRARLEMGDQKKAKETLNSLQTMYPFSFHTLIALTATGRDPGEILKSHDVKITRSKQMPVLNQLIEATEVLNRLGFPQAGTRTLDWAISESQVAEPEVRVYLAELKRDQGDYHSKIQILSDVLYKNPQLVAKETLELYFPKVFFPIFEKQSSIVDPYLLLAIARRESAFRSQVVSNANARGMLQVLPGTAKLISKNVNLMDPENNVEIGARYLLELLKRVNGQIYMALAAYNAGPNKLFVWMERYVVTDPILFIDLIPYRETREYVASVLRNYYWYRRIHRGEDKMTARRLIELATVGNPE